MNKNKTDKRGLRFKSIPYNIRILDLVLIISWFQLIIFPCSGECP